VGKQLNKCKKKQNKTIYTDLDATDETLKQRRRKSSEQFHLACYLVLEFCKKIMCIVSAIFCLVVRDLKHFSNSVTLFSLWYVIWLQARVSSNVKFQILWLHSFFRVYIFNADYCL